MVSYLLYADSQANSAVRAAVTLIECSSVLGGKGGGTGRVLFDLSSRPHRVFFRAESTRQECGFDNTQNAANIPNPTCIGGKFELAICITNGSEWLSTEMGRISQERLEDAKEARANDNAKAAAAVTGVDTC